MMRTLLIVLTLLAGGTCLAKDAAPLAADEAVEQRLNVIAEELRCLVCQNESLAGSRADLAQDLRREVRILIKQGKTDAEVKEFMVSRYGDFVLYRPPVKPTTWLLWIGPFVLLIIGVIALIVYLRRRGKVVAQTGADHLSAEQQQRAAALLAEEDKK
jgi:cytochrome c-type biogenesis protein CcmH